MTPTKRIATGLLLGFLVLPATASAISVDEIKKQLGSLLAQVATLQAQLSALTQEGVSAGASGGGGTDPRAADPSQANTISCPILNLTLDRGSQGAAVKALQQFLIQSGLLSSDAGTGYFGALTEAAVRAFQEKQGIVTSGDAATSGWGVVGPRTAAIIARVCSKSTPVPKKTTPVLPSCTPPAFTTNAVPDSALGSKWQLPIISWPKSDTSFQLTVSGLPPGIALKQQDVTVNSIGTRYWVLSGELSQAGTYSVVTEATNSCGSAKRTIQLTASTETLTQCPAVQSISCSGTIEWRGNDANGCNLGYACKTVSKLTMCPQYMPPLCPAGQHLVSGGYYDNGCEAAPTCAPDTASSLSASPLAGAAPLEVVFTYSVVGSGYDTYSIDFGDGANTNISVCTSGVCAQSATLAPRHTYTAAGVYTAKLLGTKSNTCTPSDNAVCAAWVSSTETLGTVTVSVQ